MAGIVDWDCNPVEDFFCIFSIGATDLCNIAVHETLSFLLKWRPLRDCCASLSISFVMACAISAVEHVPATAHTGFVPIMGVPR